MKKIINEKDGQELVLIPAGEFIMGSDDGDSDEAPRHKHYLDAYYMGIYPVTNLQYKKFVDETGHRPPERCNHGHAIWEGRTFPEKYAYHPVVCVSWDDANTYCEWARKRLPTEAEWEKAARGTDGRIFPWGNSWDDNKCRNHWNRELGTTCKVEEYPKGISPYGIFNMSGNVWEWCEDEFDKKMYEKYLNRERIIKTGNSRVMRGGSWYDHVGRHFRCACRGLSAPSAREANRGFRCARTV